MCVEAGKNAEGGGECFMESLAQSPAALDAFCTFKRRGLNCFDTGSHP